MNDPTPRESIQVALITVGLNQEQVDRVREATEPTAWAIVPVNFENYLSPAKRPHLHANVLNSAACVAVVDLDRDFAGAIETADFLQQLFFSRTAIIGLSSKTDADFLLRAMRAGFSEVLSSPADIAQMQVIFARLDQRWSSTLMRQQKSGKILSFFGAKGGVGTTTLAVHLAVYLVSVSKKKVILIDSHAELGHVGLYLGLDGNRYHFTELIRNVSRLDQDLLRGFTAKHASGLDVLSSPDAFGATPTPSAQSVSDTLEFLSAAYDFVVLDCDDFCSEVGLTTIEVSTCAYLVTSPEITSLRDLSRCVDCLIQHDQPAEKLQVVLNRYNSRQAVNLEQIGKAVKLPVTHTIGDHCRELNRFINMGEPVDPGSKSEFASQMVRWAASIGGNPGGANEAAGKKRFALWS